jgi:DNA (cytosine-5)-methyltransferase 1
MKVENSKKITFVDLFCGIGGFHLGIKQAAKKLKMEAECLTAVDIDEKARRTYKRYSGIHESRLLGDITKKEVKDAIPFDADIICAGFPCQPFSLVGQKNGFNDDRGTLFDHIDKIINTKYPKAIFLENVRNIVSYNEGEILKYIINKLNRAKYKTELARGKNWEILKASNFGLPTHRPRFYLVAFRKDIKSGDNFRFPTLTTPNGITLKKFFGKGWPDVIGSTIRVGGMHSPFHKNPDGSWFRDRRNWDTYLVNGKPHTLNLEETKKMMGFPYNFKFADGLSEQQSIKQLGNSVAVPVIKSIAENIIKAIYD